MGALMESVLWLLEADILTNSLNVWWIPEKEVPIGQYVPVF